MGEKFNVPKPDLSELDNQTKDALRNLSASQELGDQENTSQGPDDDDLGELSQDDIDSLLSSSRKPAEKNSDGDDDDEFPEMISQDDINSLLRIRTSKSDERPWEGPKVSDSKVAEDLKKRSDYISEAIKDYGMTADDFFEAERERSDEYFLIMAVVKARQAKDQFGEDSNEYRTFKKEAEDIRKDVEKRAGIDREEDSVQNAEKSGKDLGQEATRKEEGQKGQMDDLSKLIEKENKKENPKETSGKLGPDEIMLAEAGGLESGAQPEEVGIEKGLSEEQLDALHEKLETGEIKQEADRLFEKTLEAQENLQRINNQRNVFNKMGHVLGKGKNKEGHINKEYKEAEEKLKEAQKKYRNKYQEFASAVVQNKEDELKSQGGVKEALSGKLKNFILTEKVAAGFRKDEKGEKVSDKLTLFEYINQNEKRLAEKRAEVLSEKKKGNLQKMGEWYQSLSTKKKLVLSFGLSSAVGAGIVFAGGAGFSMALGYGALRGGKAVLRRLTTGALAGAATMGVHKGTKKWNEKREKSLYGKTEGEAAENLGNDLFKQLDQYNETLRKRERNRKIIVGVTAATLLGTAVGLEAFAGGETGGTGKLDSDNVDPKPAGAQETETPKEGGPPQQPSEVLKNIVLGDETSGSTESPPVLGETGQSEAAVEIAENPLAQESGESSASEQEQLLNKNFQLESGGTVWGRLSEHFNGDRQEIGKALAGFKAETVEDLTERGMTEAQANQFIEWRYRHMDVGTEFGLKDGKLEISGFDDENMLNRFKTENPGVVVNEVSSGQPLGGENMDQQIKADTQDRMNEYAESNQVRPAQAVHERGGFDSSITDGDLEGDLEQSEAEINNQVDEAIDRKVAEIYDHFGPGNQQEEWLVMKEKPATDILNKEYGEPLGRQLDGAEINNREQLRDYLIELMNETGETPRGATLTSPAETVEEFVRRAERMRME